MAKEEICKKETIFIIIDYIFSGMAKLMMHQRFYYNKSHKT